MKNMKYLPSFGGGYGINRNVAAEKALGVAEPPLSHVSVRPGSGFSRSATGKSGAKHFSGAKLHKRKPS